MGGSHNPARRRLSTVLNREVPIVLLLGTVAWLAPQPASRIAGWTMIAVLVLTPIGRVAWLAARWMGFDRRFGWTGWALLTAVAAAGAVAVLLR